MFLYSFDADYSEIPETDGAVGAYIEDGYVGEALSVAQESVQQFRDSGAKADELAALNTVAKVYIFAGDHEKASRAANDANYQARRAGNRKSEASALNNIARVNLAKEKYEDAVKTAKESVDLCSDIGDSAGHAAALGTIAETYLAQENKSDALTAANEAVDVFRGAGDIKGEGSALLVVADLRIAFDEFRPAMWVAREAADLFEKAGDRLKMAAALQMAAHASMGSDGTTPTSEEASGAYKSAAEALDIFREEGDARGEATALRTIGLALNAMGQKDDALQMLESSEDLFRALGLEVSAASSLLATCVVRREANKAAAMSAAKKAKRIFKAAGAKDMVEKADAFMEFLTTGRFPTKQKGVVVKEKKTAAEALGLQYSDMGGLTQDNKPLFRFDRFTGRQARASLINEGASDLGRGGSGDPTRPKKTVYKVNWQQGK